MPKSSHPGWRQPRIAVVGSINMDLLIQCQRLPKPGETIHGDSIRELPGGKGANQAVAAARLGADVSIIGRVGDDGFARRLVGNLRDERVDVARVMSSADCGSGVAIVCVEASGENAIILVAGANGLLSPDDVREATEVIQTADLLLLQLEVPVKATLEAIAVARESDTRVLLDPAPASNTLPDDLLRVDFICPNETEAALITGLPIETDDQVRFAAARLCQMGAVCVVITRGDRGALVCDQNRGYEFVESVPTRVVDTTGAGDAFAAAFAVRVAEGDSAFAAACYACRAGASAASRVGAQSAMPTREQLDVGD